MIDMLWRGRSNRVFLFDEDGDEPYLRPVQCGVPQFLHMMFRHLQEHDFNIASVLPELFKAIVNRLKYVDFISVQYLEHFAE